MERSRQKGAVVRLDAQRRARYTVDPTGQVAQLVEHRIENAGVAGSSPALPIRLFGQLKSEDRPPLSRKSCGGFAFFGVGCGQVRACAGAGQDQMGGLG